MSIEKKFSKLLVILMVVSLVPHSARGSRASAATGPFADALIPQAESQGALDTTFGDGGKVAVEVSPNGSSSSAVAIQPDGKLVAVGSADYNARSDFAVVRFNADGTLDSSFGPGGIVTTDFFGNSDAARAVAVQADGRIVAAGTALKSNTILSADFALVRYNSDGSLDTTFGSGGKVTTDASGNADIVASLVILPDGRLLVGGTTFKESTDSNDFELVRYNANGILDETFGAGGKVVTDFFGFPDDLTAIALQSDGKILAAGTTARDAEEELQDFALVRYNSEGSIDQSFGTAGKVATDFSGHSSLANAMALDGSGKIILAGTASTGVSGNPADFALARYNSDGSLDTSFGAGGKVTTDFAGNEEGASCVALQGDGKILAGGNRTTSFDGNTRDFALVRYNNDGTLDGTFGSSGKTTTDFAGLGDFANAMALQSDGKVILAGSSYHSTESSTSVAFLSLARYTAGSPAAPGFTLSFDQSPITVQRGNAAKVELLINRTGGFSGDVAITPPDASADGIKVKPGSPQPVSGGAVTFKLKIKPSAAVGHTVLTFTGTDASGHASTATLTVIVQIS
jgi:uncharacterized delta-60 repeat protein